MSARRQQAVKALFEQGLVMILLFLTPAIVSFIIFTVASGFGGTPLPPVGYGIQCVSNSNGVCALWNLPASGNSTAPPVTLPNSMVLIINSLMITMSLILGIVTGAKLAPKLFESSGGEE